MFVASFKDAKDFVALEQQINKWLADRPTIEVISVKQDIFGFWSYIMVTILYKAL